MSYLDDIIRRAKDAPQRVAFPEANDEKMMRVAYETSELGIAFPVLVGDTQELKSLCKELGFDETRFEFADMNDVDIRDKLIERYLTIPGVILGPKALTRRMGDPLKYAFVLEAVGDVDVTIGGLNTTTGDFILAAMDIIGLQDGISAASSVGICEIQGYDGSEGNVIALADISTRPDPTATELADIAITSCETIRNITGWIPRCALLSFSSDGSAKHPLVDKVKEAVCCANEKRPDLFIDGEFQLDTAIVPGVAAKKVKRPSEVAGRANIIIFPDLNSGNIGVKLMQQFGGAVLYGALLQGFKRVLSDVSRGSSVQDLVGTIALSVIIASKKK